MTDEKIYVIVPAFNEGRMVGKVIKDILEVWPKAVVVVVDDASTDNTAEVAKKAGAKVISHLINLGQGAALQTGLEFARRHSPQILVTYDADGQFLASDLPKMIKPILDKQVDVTLGSRFLGKTKNIPATRKIALKIAVVFTKIFSGLNLTDVHNGLRALGPKAIQRINLRQNRMEHASEILDQISLQRLSFVEVPITVNYTDYSLSKGQKTTNGLKILIHLIANRLT